MTGNLKLDKLIYGLLALMALVFAVIKLSYVVFLVAMVLVYDRVTGSDVAGVTFSKIKHVVTDFMKVFK